MALFLIAATAASAEKELKHDDGKQAGRKSAAGTGHAITFKAPRGKWWVRAVAVYGARYGGGYDPKMTPFDVTVCDADMRALTGTEAMYSEFRSGAFSWVDVELTEPIQVTAPFHVVVAFDPTVATVAGKNVKRVINYYLPNGENHVRRGRGFRGKLSNVNVTNMTDVTHMNVEKNQTLQNRSIKTVMSLTKPSRSRQRRRS